MAKLNIRRGDQVKVISGNSRGQEGRVLRVDTTKQRVVVEGINLRKRHRKPSALNPEGGIVTFEAPIHVSNVMLIDPATGQPTRIRRQGGERVGARSGRVIPKPQ